MSLAVKPNQIKLTFLLSGLLGLILRGILFATGPDEKGLLVAGHWADIALWILTAVVAAALYLLLRKFSGPEAYRDAFPASPVSAAGYILAACALLLSGGPKAADGKLAVAEPVLRIVAAAALVAVAYCRFAGKKPSFLFHCAVCLYLALRMVCQYRLWSSDPQLQNYCFNLGAYVALMFTAYQLAAFDAGLGSHRKLWASGLAAVYLCIMSLAESGETFFLLGCGIWAVTCLSSPKRRRRKPAFQKEGE